MPRSIRNDGLPCCVLSGLRIDQQQRGSALCELGASQELEIATTTDVERTSDVRSKGQSCGRRQLVLQISYTTTSSVR
eukprot:4083325-Prymnesium_polylepis.1